jgi:DNA repair exonuclease SbcCD ATPase subunit
MAITYNKTKITKDRRVQPSGPRDRQLRQKLQQQAPVDNSDLVSELRNQISALQDRLASSQVGGWTDDQVNAEIIKAITEETANLNKQHSEEKAAYDKAISKLKESLHEYKTQIKLYEKDIETLKEKILEKETLITELKSREPVMDNNVTMLLAEATKKIEALTTQVTSGSVDPSVSSDRPQMETVFVDPIEKESKVEKHFEVEVEVGDVSISKKEEMGNKVDKLKNLLGKLPSTR